MLFLFLYNREVPRMRRFPILSYVLRASAFLNLSWKSAKEHFSLVVGISYVGAANDCAFMSRDLPLGL